MKSEDTLCSLQADGVTVITLPRGIGGLDPSKVGAVKVKAIDCADCFTSNIDNLQEKYFLVLYRYRMMIYHIYINTCTWLVRN